MAGDPKNCRETQELQGTAAGNPRKWPANREMTGAPRNGRKCQQMAGDLGNGRRSRQPQGNARKWQAGSQKIANDPNNDMGFEEWQGIHENDRLTENGLVSSCQLIPKNGWGLRKMADDRRASHEWQRSQESQGIP